MICRDEAEVVDKLCTLGEQFKDFFRQKKYAQAMFAYRTALTVAVFMEADDDLKLFLFGYGNTDETDEKGLFNREWVSRAQWECIKQDKSFPYVSTEDIISMLKSMQTNQPQRLWSSYTSINVMDKAG